MKEMAAAEVETDAAGCRALSRKKEVYGCRF